MINVVCARLDIRKAEMESAFSAGQMKTFHLECAFKKIVLSKDVLSATKRDVLDVRPECLKYILMILKKLRNVSSDAHQNYIQIGIPDSA
jgi:hypothetical protein